ncbi:MAG: hypothetical protein V4850_32920 [Myxococcota bacterium]
MSRLLVLGLILGCTGEKPDPSTPPAPDPCAVEQQLIVEVVGAIAGADDLVAGVLDGATWRLGDAAPLTRVLARDAGVFTVCLDGAPSPTPPYESGFVAAWRDLDGDNAYDAATEALCDHAASGADPERLFHTSGRWRTGLLGSADAAGLAAPAALDGDRCAR